MSNTTVSTKTTSDTSKPAPRAIPTAPEAVAKSPAAKPTAVKPAPASVKRPAPAAPAPSAAKPAKATVAKAPGKPAKPVPVKKPAAKKPAVKASAKPIAKSLAKAADSKPAKTEKPKKAKLVRDSFTIPKDEYVVIDALKQRAGKLARSAKKSELLRAGIKALAAMSDEAFVRALAQVPAIKTGRPAAQA